MSRLNNLLRVLLMLFVFFVVAVAARADGVATYSISGVLIVTGNNTCSPAPCSEAIAFSMDLQDQLSVGEYLAQVTNLTETWTGDIASYTHSFPQSGVSIPIYLPGACVGDAGNIIGLYDAAGDQADLHLCADATPAPVVPSLSLGHLVICATTVCSSEFPDPYSGRQSVGVLEDVKVTEISEPAVLPQLALGLLSLLFLGVNFRKSSA
jgi:hypothetical protein